MTNSRVRMHDHIFVLSKPSASSGEVEHKDSHQSSYGQCGFKNLPFIIVLYLQLEHSHLVNAVKSCYTNMQQFFHSAHFWSDKQRAVLSFCNLKK